MPLIIGTPPQALGRHREGPQRVAQVVAEDADEDLARPFALQGVLSWLYFFPPPGVTRS